MIGILGFVKDLYSSRDLIWELIIRDYRQQHQGTYFGVIWNYLQPILFIATLYMVFTLGFRVGPASDIPFSLYLVSGMICWQNFTSNISKMSDVIRKYRFLVKKIDFRLSILPIICLGSSLLPHLVLCLLATIFAMFQGFTPTLKIIQILYYYTAMSIFLLGVGWLTSSTKVFVKDVGNVVGIVTQFGFWLTPVFWQIESMPERAQFFLKLNPAYYLVSGYRDAITSGQWFWEREYESLVFWAVTVLFLIVGVVVFKKLKPHFAEVV